MSEPPLPAVMLLDGGLGTTLADHHAIIFSADTPLWSSHLLLSSAGQSTLRSAQSSFARAGADVILTATYQASLDGFARSGVGAVEAQHLMRAAVRIARDAVDRAEEGVQDGVQDGVEDEVVRRRGRKASGQVALGLGAYGATMVPSQEYSGQYDVQHTGTDQLSAWHSQRIAAFLPTEAGGEDTVEKRDRQACWAGVNVVAFETLPRQDEIEAVRMAMASVNGGLDEREQRPFWICCVFSGEGHTLPDGSGVPTVVSTMLGRGKGQVPIGVGINCTRVGKIEQLILDFEHEVGGMLERDEVEGGAWPSLVIYPDGTRGEVYDSVSQDWVKHGPGVETWVHWDEAVYGIVSRARERRLWTSIFVGGCCRTSPDDIRKLRKRLDQDGSDPTDK